MLSFLTDHIPEKWGNAGYRPGRGQECALKLWEKRIMKLRESKKVKMTLLQGIPCFSVRGGSHKYIKRVVSNRVLKHDCPHYFCLCISSNIWCCIRIMRIAYSKIFPSITRQWKTITLIFNLIPFQFSGSYNIVAQAVKKKKKKAWVVTWWQTACLACMRP
jgi:hypothetical protein